MLNNTLLSNLEEQGIEKDATKENRPIEDELVEISTFDNDPSYWLEPATKLNSGWLDGTSDAQDRSASKFYEAKLKRASIAYQTADRLFRDRKYEQALICYNVAIDLKPGFVEAYCDRGAVHAALDRFQLALDDASQAISFNSKHAIAYYLRGSVHYAVGDLDLAKNDLMVAADLFKEQNKQNEYRRIIKLLEAIDQMDG